MTYLLFAITDDAQLDFRILRPFQTMHGLFVCHFRADKRLIIHLDNLIASNQSCTLCRAVANHILHTDGIVADGELDAHARERALQVIVGNLHILGGNIDRMRVELRENLRHSLLDHIVDIDGIHILIVDNMQQIVEFIATRIDDIQPMARKMVGIEGSYQYAKDDTQSHPYRGETI